MAVPTPGELIETYGKLTPELLALSLGFQIHREQSAPTLPSVAVFSEYRPANMIMLYRDTLKALAARRQEPLLRLEQWHIAHELYHGLAEKSDRSFWRVRETEADLWADELLTLATVEQIPGDGTD